MVTPKAEDYLTTIYRHQAGDERVTTSEVASAMGVKPPTVTKTLQRLAADGLVDYERYQGTLLTDRGERRALEVLRHHRLLELFLAERLGYDWTEVHAEADVLEHHISEKLEARIAEQLGYPTHDPHGDPIPTVDLEIDKAETRESLAELAPGDVAVVVGVRERTPDLLEYLAEAGVELGTTLELREVAPIGLLSLVLVESGDRLSLPENATANVFVSRLEGTAVDDNRQFSEAY